MAFTAADVKNLREMTGVGMMDCKKALAESDGNIDKAIEYLREKGLAASAKKAGRIAAEGMAYATVIDGVGVVVEVNAETDFVGKNEKFVDFVKGVAAVVAKENPADLEALMATKYNDTLTVEQQQQEMVLVIGENIKVRRFARFAEGVSVAYVHAGGKIGVLVNLDTDLAAEKVEELGKDVAMQIAAAKPQCISRADVDTDALAHEREVLRKQALEEGKPEKIVEKMVDGRINKYYKEVCLVEQEFVKDSDKTIKDILGGVEVRRFARFEMGEGLEKKNEDFAAEVAAQIK